jgi:hypothetical protein
VSTDWNAGSLILLDGYVMNLASQYSTYYGVDYITSDPIKGTVLNTSGTALFESGIPYLSAIRPNIVILSLTNIQDITDSTTTSSLDKTMSTQLGPDVTTLVTDTGTYLLNGMPGKDVLLWGLVGVWLALSIFVGAKGHWLGAAISGIPVLAIDWFLGGFNFTDFAILGIMGVFLLIRALIFNNSAQG